MSGVPRQAAEHMWSLEAGGVKAAMRLAGGRLSCDMAGSAPGMDIDLADLGGVYIAHRSPAWTNVVEARTCTEDGIASLRLVIDDESGALRLTRHVQAFTDHPFMRTWARVENLSAQEIAIDGCDIVSLLPRGPLPYCLFHVEQFSASYRRDYFTPNELWLIAGRTPHELRMGSYPSQHWGATSCAWFALRADSFAAPAGGGQGLVCGIEFNGKSRVRAWATPERAHIVSAIDEIAHRLAPGESFEVPACFLGRYEGDWDEAGYVTQRFAESHIHPSMPDERYPWAQYNSWAYDQAIDEQQQLKAIDRCAQLGLELAVLDLGWSRAIGDWRPDPVKFPRGFRPLVERARSYGMRFGVHIALAQASPSAPVAREHPDWLVYHGVDYFGAGSLCLGHAPCRDWLIGELSRLIQEEQIDYIIQDGEDMVKRCECASHTHAPGNSNYANSQYGLDAVIESLRRAYPRLVIENCEDGGCMMTYKMAGMYHTSITVDNIDTYSTRQGVYGASYPFSPRYSVRYMQDAPTRYTLLSAIFGGPLILMHRLTDWNDAQMAETRMAIARYKELRGFIRSAKIIHLKAPDNKIPGGGWGWDAIQAVSQDRLRSVVMAYRARGGEDKYNFKPRGLKEDRTYCIRLEEDGGELVCTGAQLLNEGITLSLGEFSAEVIKMDAL